MATKERTTPSKLILTLGAGVLALMLLLLTALYFGFQSAHAAAVETAEEARLSELVSKEAATKAAEQQLKADALLEASIHQETPGFIRAKESLTEAVERAEAALAAAKEQGDTRALSQLLKESQALLTHKLATQAELEAAAAELTAAADQLEAAVKRLQESLAAASDSESSSAEKPSLKQPVEEATQNVAEAEPPASAPAVKPQPATPEPTALAAPEAPVNPAPAPEPAPAPPAPTPGEGARAALNAVGGGWVPLSITDVVCGNAAAWGCAYRDLSVGIVSSLALESYDFWYPIMLHEYAHIIQFQQEQGLLNTREYWELFGDGQAAYERLADCMAIYRMPSYPYATCDGAQLDFARRMWG